MKCDRKRLSSYLDGALRPDEVRQIEEHLETCERCTLDLAAYRKINRSLRFLDRSRAPGELQRSIYRKVEEGPVRRGWVGVLLTPAVSLASVFTLIVGGVVGWRLLTPATAPVMTAAFTVQEAPESLDGLRMELVFDRAVSAESLAQAVTIDPPLQVSHRVLENKVELVLEAPLRTGSAYTVVVSNVRDQRGNVQAEPVVLNLQAGPTAVLEQESRPPTAVAAHPPTSSSPAGEHSVSAGSKPGIDSTGSSLLPSSPPTLPSGTNLALLEDNPDLRHRLGAPRAPERLVPIGEQAFQGGAMLFRADTNQIFALLRPSERWLPFANTWRPGEVLPSAGLRPPGTLEPLRGFGKAWRDQPTVQLQLGWPVYGERSSVGLVQNFEHGALVRSSYGVAYALFNDGSWRALRVAQ